MEYLIEELAPSEGPRPTGAVGNRIGTLPEMENNTELGGTIYRGTRPTRAVEGQPAIP